MEHARVKAIFLGKAEKSFYYQKAKCFYIRDGDRSTKFFHNMSKRNSKRNYVPSIIKLDGVSTESTTEVLDEFLKYYTELIGTRTTCSPLDESVFDYGPCLGDEERIRLDSDVSEDEIKAALFDIHDDKAPGPDGYSAHFFKKAWGIVGPLLIEAVMEFFSSGRLLRQWNTTILSLIPKSTQAQTVGDFRPIA